MFDRSRFHKGEDVFDCNDNKVGSIEDVASNHFDVSAGLLGFEHLYIPFNEVSRVEDDKVYLKVSKDQIGQMGWQNKPAGFVGAGQREMYGTMPAATETERGIYTTVPEELTGYTVYSSDNKEIGKVYDQGPGYVHLHTGLFGLGGELWIPTNCIDRCSTQDQRCYLRVPHDQIKNMDWHKGPEHSLQAGCGEMTGQRGFREGESTPGGYEEKGPPTGS